MKHELLSPAGNMESLKQAVHNGADAVYVASKNFGARKFATNFTNEELIEAIKYCHLYGVKIYVTMNTLIKNSEVDSFLKQAEFLHKSGVDAVIVQDFGMICLLREKYPNLEIHASTQANTSSKETAELFYNLGVKRVVFSRELSLEEINNIDVPIEKEVFIHGALCISYSGCCLMSSMIGTRSGNRGECTGCCRLKYTLMDNKEIIEKDKYLLSTKELNTSQKFKHLLESDIISFKIEGRMKSPEYVGFITRYYRNIIDNYENDLIEETNKLKTIYNREFTTGRLFNVEDNELMNIKTPNHIGLEIGKVIEVTEKKIKIKLNKPLHQHDGIRFLNSGKGFIINFLYDKKDNLIKSSDSICYVDNKVDLKENDIVCKTLDYNLMNELRVLPQRKIPISIKVTAKLNQPLTIEVFDDTNKLQVIGKNVEESINAPITKERIKQQIEKLGETPFISTNTQIISDDNIFISIKELNELRRKIINKLIDIRMNTKKEVIINEVKFSKCNKTENKKEKTASVHNEEQLLACINLGMKRIYVNELELYEKYKDKENVYYICPRNTYNIKSNLKEKNIISEYYNFDQNKKNIANYSLNIFNIYTAYYLSKMNINVLTLSVELTKYEIEEFIELYEKKFSNNLQFEVLVYGKVENMIIKGNILNLKENKKTYSLIDNKNRSFKTYYDGRNTHILNFENKKEIINKNNIAIRYDFYDETKEEIEKIVNSY